MKKLMIAFFISVVAFAASAYSDDADNKVNTFNSKTPFIPGEIIVKVKGLSSSRSISSSASVSIKGASKIKVKKLTTDSPKQAKSKISSTGVNIIGEDENLGCISGAFEGPGVYKVSFDGRDDVHTVAEELKNDPNIEYAEPNYLYQLSAAEINATNLQGWQTTKIGGPAAWDVTQGTSNVIVAVIDTGVDYKHPDLASHIWRNSKEIPSNGIDDDKNGYIDDTIGWDFVSVPSNWVAPNEDPGPADKDPMDVLGHGTHVSGIVAGMAAGCTIMPLRAGYLCIDGGGYLELSDIAEAIYYAANNGASVINMSFGSPYQSTLLRDAVNYSYSKGVIMVASSGNVDTYDAGKLFYPAAYDHVIAVSAVDNEDKLSIWGMFAFSNFGDFVDICAPGTGIYSTLPNNGYGSANGTSMASPLVAAVAALVRSKYTNMNSDQVEARIKTTSDHIYGINAQAFLANKLGSGRVNAKRALGNLCLAIDYPRPNSIISGSVAVKGSASIEAFKNFKLEYSSITAPNDWKPIVAQSTKPIDSGLLAVWSVNSNDGQYNIRVTVTNISGEVYQKVSGVNFGPNGDVKLSAKPMCGPSPYDPSTGQFLFYYDLLAASDVDIYVYDVSGKLIYRKACPYDGATAGVGGSAGQNRVYWDGVNNFGETLGNGAYVYMIVAKDSGDRKIIGRGKFAVARS